AGWWRIPIQPSQLATLTGSAPAPILDVAASSLAAVLGGRSTAMVRAPFHCFHDFLVAQDRPYFPLKTHHTRTARQSWVSHDHARPLGAAQRPSFALGSIHHRRRGTCQQQLVSGSAERGRLCDPFR